MRLENISTNDDLLDGSTKRRLTLAEVEPSKGFGGWLTDVGTSLPTYRISCDAGSDDLLGMDVPSGLLRVCITKQIRLIGFDNKWRIPVHCHREKQQSFTTLHSAVSHSVNEVW